MEATMELQSMREGGKTTTRLQIVSRTRRCEESDQLTTVVNVLCSGLSTKQVFWEVSGEYSHGRIVMLRWGKAPEHGK